MTQLSEQLSLRLKGLSNSDFERVRSTFVDSSIRAIDELEHLLGTQTCECERAAEGVGSDSNEQLQEEALLRISETVATLICCQVQWSTYVKETLIRGLGLPDQCISIDRVNSALARAQVVRESPPDPES